MSRMHCAVLVLAAWMAAPFAGASSADAAQRWAMLVGIDQYAKIENLEFAGNDQRVLGSELLKLGFPQDQIRLLHDVAKQKKNLPFRENIERELDLLLKMTSSNDIVVFSFSGHGVHLNGKSYLCPTEADFDRPAETLISLDSVFDRLAKCRASVKIMLVDACRNDPRPAGARAARGSVTSGFTESLEKPPSGLLLLTSCSPGQISMEDNKLQHGVFMYHLLEGLRGKAANSEGSITLNALYDYTSLATKKYVATRWSNFQSPGFKGELTGPFEFARINKAVQQLAVTSSQRAENPDQSTLTGMWNGSYSYPSNAGRAPVGFSLIVVQDGGGISGFIKERNTFGATRDPYLHASFRGSYDSTNLKISWIKTYDGTADVDHDVYYTGRVSGDGSRILSGQWQIPGNWGATFSLSKDTGTQAGKWSGVWAGTHYYPEVTNRSPMKFSMIVVERGSELVGYINERRTYGAGDDPWFHATVGGRFNDTTGEMAFTKAYDGTAGMSEQIEYRGKKSEDEGGAVSGEWKSRNGSTGTFTLTKSPSSR